MFISLVDRILVEFREYRHEDDSSGGGHPLLPISSHLA